MEHSQSLEQSVDLQSENNRLKRALKFKEKLNSRMLNRGMEKVLVDHFMLSGSVFSRCASDLAGQRQGAGFLGSQQWREELEKAFKALRTFLKGLLWDLMREADRLLRPYGNQFNVIFESIRDKYNEADIQSQLVFISEEADVFRRLEGDFHERCTSLHVALDTATQKQIEELVVSKTKAFVRKTKDEIVETIVGALKEYLYLFAKTVFDDLEALFHDIDEQFEEPFVYDALAILIDDLLTKYDEPGLERFVNSYPEIETLILDRAEFLLSVYCHTEDDLKRIQALQESNALRLSEDMKKLSVELGQNLRQVAASLLEELVVSQDEGRVPVVDPRLLDKMKSLLSHAQEELGSEAQEQ
eukprot:TRINITY_DN3228_c0_g1_i1.p1 TRINITY_DN3228_c0_g1~~TRINITY_DN3228_c0_g1_i1.p1  ORF type:complete len:358 (-),score=83.75 TRINITY_DN3228_c0_g1_i1:1121-2194(-)